MMPIQTLFNQRLDALQSMLLAARLQDNPALWLYQNNARTPLFYLEAMCRVLAIYGKKKTFAKWTKRFKVLEDGLGAVDYVDVLHKELSHNSAVPAAVNQQLIEQRQLSLLKLNGALFEGDWFSDTDSRIDKIRAKKVDWPADAQLVDGLTQLCRDKIAQITVQLDSPIVDIENDLHELRRDIRWLSIYPQAFAGYVQLTPEVKTVGTKFDKYLTDKIIHSPFNQLPFNESIAAPLQLKRVNFYAMSWVIDALGVLKDQGLRLDALTHSLHLTAQIAPEAAQLQAMAILGKQQASIEEIISAATVVTTQIKKDEVLSGLIG